MILLFRSRQAESATANGILPSNVILEGPGVMSRKPDWGQILILITVGGWGSENLYGSTPTGKSCSVFVSCVSCVRSCARGLPGTWHLRRARVLLLLLAVAPPGSRLVSWLVSRCPGGCPGLASSVSRLVSRCPGGCPGVAPPVSGLVSRPPPPRHGPVVSRRCPGWCPGLLLAVAPSCPDGVPWVSRLVSRGVPG